MIPKTIHALWLSGDAMPEAFAANIDTWRRHNPRYTLTVHDRQEFLPLEDTCEYYRAMLRNRSWAFASDYVRAMLLLAEGGWYTDTDARCHKPLDGIAAVYGDRPRYLCKEAQNGRWIESGVMAYEPCDALMRATVEYYERWREGDDCLPMPFVMERVARDNGIDLGDLLPDEVLSGKRCQNKVALDRKTGHLRVMIVVEPTELSFVTHHFSHSGY